MEEKQRPISWEEFARMCLAGKTAEIYHSNDGPDDGYCARGQIARVATEGAFCHVYCSTVTQRKEKGDTFEQLSENFGHVVGCHTGMTPAPTIDDAGVLRYWMFPGTCVRIHTKTDLPLT